MSLDESLPNECTIYDVKQMEIWSNIQIMLALQNIQKDVIRRCSELASVNVPYTKPQFMKLVFFCPLKQTSSPVKAVQYHICLHLVPCFHLDYVE